MHVSDYLCFGLPDEQPRATCPACGFEAPLDAFDVLGMEDGQVLCNECGEPFPWEDESESTREKIQRLLF